MKKNTTLLLLTALLFTGMCSCTGQKKETDEKFRAGWELVWEDDFDEGLNETEWTKIPRGKRLMDRYMSRNDALYLSQEGNLVLRAMENSVPNDTMPFLTGGITRGGLKAGAVARIEVKVRVNPAEGATHFLSLLPADRSKHISIDLMEHFGLDQFIYQSVSSEYTTTGGMAENPPSSSLVGVNPTQYRIYGVEKYPDSLVFFVDDLRTRKYPRILTDMPGQFPFDTQDFQLFLGIRLNKDTDTANLPADLLIDWVRIYKPKEGIE
ncbi:MAG: family 16 glycosylhydrolase [Proteiniphilum sp.]|nr:family 16 glycosylhydrolase [Proteiniphilum sp.]